MNFSLAGFAIRKWQFTIVVFALLAALGIAAFLTIPRTEDPSLNPPTFIINAVLPGVTPRDIEQLVTKPLENALYKLDAIREVRSQSRDGISTTRVEFVWGTNPETTYDQVSREVSALRPTLPNGVVRIDVIRARPIGVAFYQAALVSDTLPMRRLEKVADKLREKLGAITGVNEAKYWGTPASEMRVSLDPLKMAALGVAPLQVSEALRAGGSESPIGRVEAMGRRFDVQYEGAYKTQQAVETVPIFAKDGSILKVRDVAKVGWEENEPDHITRFNGRRAVLITVTQSKNEDVTRLTKEVTAVLDEYEKTLPGGVSLVRGFKQADNVKARLGLLGRDFLIALGLVLITLLPLGVRAAAVVILAIPLSLLIGVAVLQAFGYTLNQLAVSGFVVALGLLVDDAIVVVENIARWLREGASRREAAIKGTQQITLAVIGCTACLMLSFLPLMALPEGPGEFIRALPVTVLATVGGSFLVAITLIPLVASNVLKPNDDPHGNPLLQAMTVGIQRFYSPVLHRALDRPKIWLTGLLAMTLLSLPIIRVIGTSLFPPAETPQFLIRIDMPQGTSLHNTDQTVKQVEKKLASVAEVAWYSSNVGRGNPQVYYNVGQKEIDAAFGEIAVSLKTWESGKSEVLLEELRKEFSEIAGAKISIVTFVNGPEIEAPIVIRILGPDLNTLRDLAAKAENSLSTTPGLRDINNPLRLQRTTVGLNVDDQASQALGVRAGAIRQSLQLSLSGVTVANLRDVDGDNYPVKVRLPMQGFNGIDAFSKMYVPTVDGSAVKMSAVAQPVLDSQPARVERIRRSRSVTLTAYVNPNVLIANATSEALARIKQSVELPPGYSILLGGQAETQSRSFAGFLPAIVISSLGILAVLVLEFGKFRTVAVVFGIVPFGLLGAVIALWITGHSLSFTATIGLIALIGIEIKNSILLVDFTEQLRKEGLPIREAVEKAGELRFLPVVLTSVTAIGGLLPLAIENNGLLSPTAITLIGGLIASTLLARIATPVMYLLLAQGSKGEQA
jgi:multidrug efflux pump subunit AcrB